MRGREREYFAHFFRTYAHDALAVSDGELDLYVRAYSRPGALRAGFAYYQAMADNAAFNQEAARAQLGMPVLALGGSAMLGPMVEDVMRQVASDVRGAVIASCGHRVAAEQPQALVDHLVGFLGDGP